MLAYILLERLAALRIHSYERLSHPVVIISPITFMVRLRQFQTLIECSFGIFAKNIVAEADLSVMKYLSVLLLAMVTLGTIVSVCLLSSHRRSVLFFSTASANARHGVKERRVLII